MRQVYQDQECRRLCQGALAGVWRNDTAGVSIAMGSNGAYKVTHTPILDDQYDGKELGIVSMLNCPGAERALRLAD